MGEEANEYEFLRIGTASEKQSVEKELQELRERLSHVDEWKRRRQEIDEELSKIWVGEDESAREAVNQSPSAGDDGDSDES